MGRPSNREQRRAEIVDAFARVLGEHGYAGATIAAVAVEAGFAPGLIHHHFKNKEDLLSALLETLMQRFRARTDQLLGEQKALSAYGSAALALGEQADRVAARCWVGIFAEAVRNPRLFKKMRRLLDAEVTSIERRSGGALNTKDSGAVLAFIVGSLVLGAFAPQKTAGFAAPALERLLDALQRRP